MFVCNVDRFSCGIFCDSNVCMLGMQQFGLVMYESDWVVQAIGPNENND